MQEIRRDSGRCVTGIEDLDKILGGGIPVGNMVLVVGGCGTGKTTLAFEFLVRGALIGEKGLFVTTVESPAKLLSNLPHFDFFDERMIDDGRIKILQLDELEEIASQTPEIDATEKGHRLVEVIKEIIEKDGIKRLVIDSFTSFLNDDEKMSARRQVLRKLSSILFEKRCTAMIISDEIDDCEGIIADGMILLSNFERRGDLLRIMQVIKMKGTDHSRSKYVIDLTDCGILATPLLRGGSS